MRRIAAISAGCGVVLALVGAARVEAASDDPLRGDQWGVSTIHAPRAWTVTEGSGMVVGVIDTGVDLDHEDLAGRLLRGRDFVDDDADPSDEHGHGTLVAGIIAARSDNGLGGAGVAPLAKILPVRALDEDGRGEPETVAEAIRWTADRGADVINLSLTVDQSESALGGELFTDRQVEDAIEDAADAGVLVLIASGNDPEGGNSETSYDSTRDEVLVIGASTIGDKRAAYSNFGSGLDLVAPGGGDSTRPGNAGCRDGNWIVSTWWTGDAESMYGATCGTSMATAFASGVGALLRSRGMDAVAASQRMRATARDLGPAGRDNNYGFGRIDAAAAVGAQGVAPSPPPSTSRPSSTATSAPMETPSVVATTTPTSPPAASPEPSEEPIVAVPPFDTGGSAAGGERSYALIGIAAALILAAAASIGRVRVSQAAAAARTASSLR